MTIDHLPFTIYHLPFTIYHLPFTIDQAYKAVKLIKTPTVWENMAHMCIKTKRLDVAEYCISNMGNIRGARALREAAEYKEVDARVGTVAVHLGLIEDARKLFAGCERFDLLNNLFQVIITCCSYCFSDCFSYCFSYC